MADDADDTNANVDDGHDVALDGGWDQNRYLYYCTRVDRRSSTVTNSMWTMPDSMHDVVAYTNCVVTRPNYNTMENDDRHRTTMSFHTMTMLSLPLSVLSRNNWQTLLDSTWPYRTAVIRLSCSLPWSAWRRCNSVDYNANKYWDVMKNSLTPMDTEEDFPFA